ncbi:MAG: hypothetical protein ACFHWZ_00550 [Phycisphaerales bacterium]
MNWPSATPRPHISAALQHLRFGIAAAAVVLALSLVGQALVWGFVHFTEVRVVQLEDQPDETRFDIVKRAQPSQNTVGTISGVSSGASVGAAGNRSATVEPKPKPTPDKGTESEGPVDPNRVESASDRVLRDTAALVQTVGVISAVLLLILMLQGVVVAGGGAVPGVEMAVTATSWAVIIAMVCIPLGNLLPNTPFQGVFAGYDTIVAQSEAYRTNQSGAPGARAVRHEHRPARPALDRSGGLGAALPLRRRARRHLYQRQRSPRTHRTRDPLAQEPRRDGQLQSHGRADQHCVRKPGCPRPPGSRPARRPG